MKVNTLYMNEVIGQKKLTEMLNRFSEGIMDEVFMIQNENNTNAKGVLINAGYFEELLAYQKAIDEVFDYLIKEEAITRENK
ncbi:hypothetical protein BTO30_11020 [Domibacillus antri]|uniref:Prevent-host-death protein n=1 Tax=Domibacillus antri TaxID=1714264 RepID=A0A1Q8Q4R9_9BACI|nr:hypothetical protein [Domibacillus antri]OLN22271.1 hypothetical protein BTO30_11020 [Domibacillus antri]